jgi:hypothetical protein
MIRKDGSMTHVPPHPWPSRLLSKLERAHALAKRYSLQGRPQEHIDRMWRTVHPYVYQPIDMGPR